MSIERSAMINTTRAAVWDTVEGCFYEAFPDYESLQEGLEIKGYEVQLNESLSILGKTALLDARVTELASERRLKIEAELRRVCAFNAALELTSMNDRTQVSAFVKVPGLRGRLFEPAIAPFVGAGLSKLTAKATVTPPSTSLDKIA